MMSSTTAFGRACRELFFSSLDPHVHFLNHGSYGATANPVMEARVEALRRVEANVDVFFRHEVRALHLAAQRALAPLVGLGGDASSLVFVDNATAGVQTALQAALRAAAAAGKHAVLVDFSSTYNACQIIVAELAAASPHAASHARVQLAADGAALDLSDADIVDVTRAALVAAAAARPDAQIVLLVDHITSLTGALMPVAGIVAAARAVGATVVIDGAHAIGQLPIDLTTLDCDFYVSNLHKWLFAPRHVAFLHAHQRFQPFTQPLLISHHHHMSFQQKFLMQGTRDETRWIVVPAVVRFINEQLGGLERIWAYQQAFLERACARLTAAWGTRVCFGPERRRAMALIGLPELAVLPTPVSNGDAFAFFSLVFRKFGIVVPVQLIAGRLFLRISAQVYVDDTSIDALLDAFATVRAAKSLEELGFDRTRDWATYEW